VNQGSAVKDGERATPMQPIAFAARLRQEGVQLTRSGIATVQINVGKLCNQACLHCHVDAGPKRTEIMDRRTAELALAFVRAANAPTVDLTGALFDNPQQAETRAYVQGVIG
jgi:hypothetical protein